jgi:hypothetical protein
MVSFYFQGFLDPETGLWHKYDECPELSEATAPEPIPATVKPDDWCSWCWKKMQETGPDSFYGE